MPVRAFVRACVRTSGCLCVLYLSLSLCVCVCASVCYTQRNKQTHTHTHTHIDMYIQTRAWAKEGERKSEILVMLDPRRWCPTTPRRGDIDTPHTHTDTHTHIWYLRGGYLAFTHVRVRARVPSVCKRNIYTCTCIFNSCLQDVRACTYTHSQIHKHTHTHTHYQTQHDDVLGVLLESPPNPLPLPPKE